MKGKIIIKNLVFTLKNIYYFSKVVNSTIQCLIYVACIVKKWRNLVFIFKSDLSDAPKNIISL